MAEESAGLWGMVGMSDMVLRAHRDTANVLDALRDLEPGYADALSRSVGVRLDGAGLDQLMEMPELDFTVHKWSEWGDAARIREVFSPMVDDDDRLLALLDKFVRTGLRSSGSKTVETYKLSMKPLAIAIDVHAAEPRVRSLLARSDLSERQRAAASGLVTGLRRIAEGRDSDDPFQEDD